MPYGSIMLYIPTKIFIKPLEKQRATQKSLAFGKWRFRENKVRRMGQEQKRIRKVNLTR